MKRLSLLLWLGLASALGGCNYDAALETYCRDTGLCKQVGDSWCSGPGAPCLNGCCGRLVCGADGMCGSGQRSALSIVPTEHDFGEYSPGNPAPPPEKEFVITNTGQLPTVALEAGLNLTTASFAVDGAGCEGKALAPGESCTVRVRFTPSATSHSYGANLEVKEAQDLEDWKVQALAHLRGSAGVFLEVKAVGDGRGRVVSTTAGIDCGSDCNERVASHIPFVLEARYGPGTLLAGWTGCGATEGDHCTVDVNTSRTVTAEFRAWLQVEVRHADGSEGVVQGTKNEVDCGNSYSRNCSEATDQPVVLRAVPGRGHAFVGWEGACTGEQLECHLPMTGPSRVIAHFSPYNRVFTVNDVPADALQGDLSGADLLCARYAPYSAPNDYRAWLSVEGRPAHERLGNARGWLKHSDYSILVPFADTVEDILAGRLLNTPPGASRPVATGAGATSAAERCGEWSSASGTHVAGNASAATGSWVRDEGRAPTNCSALVSIYCFGTRYRAPVRLAPVAGRLTFLSSPWTPAGGLAGADAHCQSDATAAGHTGSFKAYLAVVGKSASARVTGDGGFVRPDGIAVGHPLPDYATAPINVTADGQYIGSSGRTDQQTLVWTGGGEYAPTAVSTCNDWQGGAGSGKVGRPEFSGRTFVDAGLTAPCTSAQRLYCLQD